MSPLIGSFPFAGPPAQMDSTDRQAVSLYGYGNAAGDTAIMTESITRGNMRAAIYGGGNGPVDVRSNGDAFPGAINLFGVNAHPLLWNGTTYDRQRGNHGISIASSGARTAEYISSDLQNYNNAAFILIVNVTARAGATTLTPSIQLKDPVSLEYVTIWTAAAAINSADGTFTFVFGYNVIAAGGSFTEKIAVAVPRPFRVIVTPNNADSVTYSVAGDWL